MVDAASFPLTLYDRPGLAIGALAEGDLTAAGTALIAPGKLPPSRLSPVGQKLMGSLWETAKKNPFLRGIMSVATDPLFIAMMFISSRYPVMGARKLFDIGRKYAGPDVAPGLFSGLFGRAERIFANTKIPGLMIRSTQKTNEFTLKWGGKAAGYLEEFKKSVGRYPNAQENLQLGAKLSRLDRAGTIVAQPLLKNRIRLNPALQRLHDHMANEFFPVFSKEVVTPLQASGAHGKVLSRVAERSGLSVEALRGIMAGNAGKTGYFPRTLIRTPEMVREYADEILRVTKGDPKAMAAINVAKTGTQMTGHALPRRGVLIPSKEELAAVGEVNPVAWAQVEKRMRARANTILNAKPHPKALSLVETVNKSRGLIAEGATPDSIMEHIKGQLRKQQIMPSRHQHLLKEIRGALTAQDSEAAYGALQRVAAAGVAEQRFSLAFTPVINNYVHSFARPFVWNVERESASAVARTIGMALKAETEGLNPQLAGMMKTDYLPILQGQTTYSQTKAMLRWSNTKLRAIESLETGALSKLVPAKTRDKLVKMMTQEKGPFGYLNANAKLAGYFYYSALGFNPSSAFQNLLQPVITTMPLIGPKPFWQGMTSTVKKLGRYYDLRGKGVVAQEAMAKVFPKFTAAGLGTEPLSQAILRDSLEGMWQGAQALPAGAIKMGSRPWLQRTKRAAMAMFSASERFNRLVTFEAGLKKAAMSGMKGEAAQGFAAKVVRATQFPAGPGQMPHVLLNLSAPWRQFMYFPIRYAGLMGESLRYGGGTGLNLGTVARTIGYSAAARHMIRGVTGAEMGRSLMLGALPLPQYEQSPFYPLPVVPPLAGLAGAAAMSAAGGTLDPLRRASGLMVPGGIQARRIYRNLSPKYARYSEQVGGKIPLYSDKQSLIGYQTPMQLFMRSIGLRPSDAATEQGLTKYLLTHRDEIRDFRRRYVEALVMGNPEEAQRIQSQFRRQYPGLGDIVVKKSDLKAAEDRRSLTRLGRLTRTLPKEYRGQFEDVVSAAMANYTANAFGPPETMPFATMTSPTGDLSSTYGSPSGMFD